MEATVSVSTAAATAAPAVKQYSARMVLAVWAAAALPMGALAWFVAPTLVDPAADPRRFVEVLIACLFVGLVWQFALVVLLVARERPGWRWPAIRDALWLRPPSANGRRGGRLWLWFLPFAVGFAALQFLPVHPPVVAGHDFGAFLGSADGKATLHGNWGLFVLSVAMFVFNTVLGEELLFRGLLLPRMRGAFGRYDWIVNAVLFGAYHLHQPWSIPDSIVAGTLMAYPTRRWRSAWLGILVHSMQSVFLAVLLLTLVL
jgi:hypothetical protein